ncbi:MAG: class I SAM-dependent methyltransferase [candidate division KSB1 bacterium]|jgi:SAM-dependent methyltransferase|nr:class I SAM-dependent methyltransferase [candidate division KSB1 bacterium]
MNRAGKERVVRKSDGPDGGGQYHFDPGTYLQNIRKEVPEYDEMQDIIAGIATQGGVKRFLDLGAGTGETALRILEKAPHAEAFLVEEQESMVAILRERFSGFKTVISQSDFEFGFAEGPFCAAVSLFAVHHLKGAKKKALFQRIHTALKPNGLWVFGDVYRTDSSVERRTPVDPVYDFPGTMQEVEAWLMEVGFDVNAVWCKRDLAVYGCRK